MAPLTTVRLDIINDNDADRLRQFLTTHTTKYMVYIESGDVTGKRHLQGYAELNDYSIVKAEFVRAFGGTHTRFQRSFTIVRKVEAYMRYVAKDKELAYKAGYADDHQEKMERESYKKKPADNRSVIERCYDAIVDEYTRDPNPRDISWGRKIAAWLCEDAVARNKGINVYSMRATKNAVLYKLNAEDGRYRDDIITEIDSKF